MYRTDVAGIHPGWCPLTPLSWPLMMRTLWTREQNPHSWTRRRQAGPDVGPLQEAQTGHTSPVSCQILFPPDTLTARLWPATASTHSSAPLGTEKRFTTRKEAVPSLPLYLQTCLPCHSALDISALRLEFHQLWFSRSFPSPTHPGASDGPSAQAPASPF